MNENTKKIITKINEKYVDENSILQIKAIKGAHTLSAIKSKIYNTMPLRQ